MTSSNNHNIRLICFDLGGVLVRICRSWEEGCIHAGLDVRGDSDTEDKKNARGQITALPTIGKLSHKKWLEEIQRCLGGLYETEEIIRIHEAWLIEEYPACPGLIDAIHRLGLETACLSNTTASHWARLIHEPNSPFPTCDEPEFPSICNLKHHSASHLLGVAKPDGGIFKAFEEETGFPGNEILFFDDLEDNVSAARDAGWQSVLVDPNQPSTVPQMTESLRSYGFDPEIK